MPLVHMPFWRRFLKSFTTIPQHFYVWWFNVAYHNINKNSHSYFWFREVFHVAGGMLYGVASQRLPHGVYYVPAIMGLQVGVMEYIHYRGGQTKFKTLIDVLSWNVGFALAYLLKLIA